MGRGRRGLGFAAIVALLVAGLAAPPAVAGHSGGATCVTAYPTANLSAGQMATGWTVVKGTTPQSFTAMILGVLPDAIAPGRDMVVAELSGGAVSGPGTAWAGMSGSPVYIGGRLAGVVAYALAASSSLIVGLTTGEDALAVLDLPASSAGAASVRSAATVERVELPTAMRRTIADRAGLRPWQVPGELNRMALPLSISGVPRDRLGGLAEAAERAGLALVPHTGSAVRTAQTTTAAHHVPGGNIAAGLSYGDVSMIATGTTTYVCGTTALGFGHPFLHEGAVAMGASTATALGIVMDRVFGAYKLAVADPPSGVVDQDRLAGVRADLGRTLTLIPITSTVADLDTDRKRTGKTEVVSSEFVPFVAWSHALGNLVSVVDRIGGGSATGAITLKGTREGGGTFTLQRSNRYASSTDIISPPANELLAVVATLAENPFEEIEFTSVDLQADVDDSDDFLTVDEVFVDHGGGLLEPVTEVFLEPGGTTEFVVTLESQDGAPLVARVALDVPEEFAGADGTLRIGGGGLLGGDDPAFCLFFPDECSVVQDADDFDGLLAALANAPRQDDLVATLDVFPLVSDPFVPSPDQLTAEGSTRLTRVVDGEVIITAHVLPALPGVERIAGSGRVGTSVEVSKAGFDGADHVVIARSDDASDALVALPLAASLDAPLLYSSRTGLSDEVAGEIARLGATAATIVGGTGALGVEVAQDLAALGLDVERLGGVSRWDTSRLVAERVARDVGAAEVLLVPAATRNPERSWSAAIAAAGLAAGNRLPVILTDANYLPAESDLALRSIQPASVTVVGAAVTDQVVAAVGARAGDVTRLTAGEPTRYGVAAAAADLVFSDPFRVVLATARNYPDALLAAHHAARLGGTYLLVDGMSATIPTPTAERLASLGGAGADVTIVGGVGAVSLVTADAIQALI